MAASIIYTFDSSRPVTSGKTQFSDRNGISKAIASFEGRFVSISVFATKKRGSNPQNRYYWGVIIKLVILGLQDTYGERFPSEEVHSLLKGKFSFRELVNEETGEIERIPIGYRHLTTVQREDFHESCRQWAKEFLNIEIPLPNEQIEIDID